MSVAETLCAPSIAPAASPGGEPLAAHDTPDDLDLLAPAIARAERRLRILQDLTDLGMRLTRIVVEQAEAAGVAPAADEDVADAPVAPRANPANDFARLSRAVRLTVNLEARADETLRALLAGDAPAREARRQARERRETAQADTRRKAARDRVETLVMEVIDREAETAEDYVDLEDALRQRIEHDEAYEGLEDLPLGAVVERLCEDLRLTPDWRRWTGLGWIEDNPRLRPRRSPFNRKSRKPIEDDDEPPDRSA
jgi:hypothetical protein